MADPPHPEINHSPGYWILSGPSLTGFPSVVVDSDTTVICDEMMRLAYREVEEGVMEGLRCRGLHVIFRNIVDHS